MNQSMSINDYISLGINLFLMIITLSAVFYAKRSLIASDSPRVVVTNYKKRISSTDDYFFTASINVKNFGNGVAIKTFVALK